MSWLGLRDQKGVVFGSEGVGQQAKGRKSPNTRLTQGTLSNLPAALWRTLSPLAPEILQPFEVYAWSKIQVA